MAKYEVIITETLCKTVEVEASTPREARIKAERMHGCEEIVLTADDLWDIEFETIRLDRNE